MSKKSLFQEAVADAKAISKAAVETAKLTLAEHFAPKVEKMVDAKLRESLEEEYEEDEEVPSEEVDEAKKKSSEEEKSSEEGEPEDEEINLEALLKELESEDDAKSEVEESYASEEEDGKKSVKPMDEKKSEEESSEEEVDEERATYLKLKEKFEPKKKSSEEEKSSEEGEEEKDFDVDEDINVEALLKELEEGDGYSEEEVTKEEKFGSEEKDGKKSVKPMDENLKSLVDKLKSGAANVFDDFKKDFEALKDPKERKAWLQSLSTTLGRVQGVAEEKSEEGSEDLEKVKSELNEALLVNAKTIFFGKFCRDHDNLSKSDKVNFLKQIDKCSNAKEAKLVYETISNSMKSIKKPSSTKKNLRESISFASNAAGTSTAKRAKVDEGKEIVSSDLAARWKFLAFGDQK